MLLRKISHPPNHDPAQHWLPCHCWLGAIRTNHVLPFYLFMLLTSRNPGLLRHGLEFNAHATLNSLLWFHYLPTPVSSGVHDQWSEKLHMSLTIISSLTIIYTPLLLLNLGSPQLPPSAWKPLAWTSPHSVPNKASSLGGSLGTLCSCGLSLPSGQSHYGRAGGRDSGPCVSQGPAYVGLWMGVVSISLFALPVTMWDLCPVSELRELEAPVHADLGANVGLVPDLRNQATISIKWIE